jgi:SAM-dependent methyltransferase
VRLSTVVRSIGLTVSNAVRVGLDPGAIPDPPLRLAWRVGRGDYRAIGEELRRIVIDRAGLRPFDRILDIGCGVGRVAAPLTRYLTDGTYEGFDIDAELVDWCRTHITRRHPRFRFRHVDLKSGLYNPSGVSDAAGFEFPYDTGAFTFVVATSVFTHLVTADAENYLRQAGRVLAPGGTLLATFFLLDDEAESLMAGGRAHLDFPAADTAQVHRPLRTDKPEAAVAYPAEWLRRTLASAGFSPDMKITPGSWCGRTETLTYQDVVIARKA